MQNQFYNQPVVNWAKQNLAQPVEIKLLFGKRWQMFLVYALLFSIPLLIVACFIFLKLRGGTEASWGGVFLCGGVLMLPCFVIVLVGVFTRQKLVKSMDASGVKSSMGRKFLWQNLYFIDHVSKHTRVANVSRKVKDNQIELVFADGKAIIPPLIQERERIWNFVNTIPAQVKFDGEVKPAQRSAANNPAPVTSEDFLKMLNELDSKGGGNK